MGSMSNLDLVPEFPMGAPHQAEAAPSGVQLHKEHPLSSPSNQGSGNILCFASPLHSVPHSPLQSQP